MRYPNRWTVGEWTFIKIEDHGFTGELADKPLYGFVVGEPEISGLGWTKFGELYASLEHAMVAAVGEKYAGKRGAGGTGVDTAAGWFMRMIGADQLQPAGDVGSVALTSALVGQGVTADRWTVQRIEKALEGLGVVLAHVKS